MTLDDTIAKYVALRDWKTEKDRAHKAKMAKTEQMLDQLEAVILQDMQTSGAESVRTEHGTAYKTTKRYVNVADWDLALDFIKEHELWNMLEKRISKTAVEEYRAEHEDIPPGVSVREELTVNIRRA